MVRPQLIPVSAILIAVLATLFAASNLIFFNESTSSILSTELLVFCGLAPVVLLVLLRRHIFHTIINPIEQLSSTLLEINNNNALDQFANHKTASIKTLANACQQIQQECKTHQRELENQALHDTLTNLPNRILFNNIFTHLIKECDRNKTTLSLLCLDLNRFKEINDNLGFDIGDQILTDVASRLSNLLRKMDIIARLGDDEFAILLKNPGLEDTQKVVEKITNLFSIPFLVSNHQLLISISLGVALYPEHGSNPVDLVRNANIAMQSAKLNHFAYVIYNAKDDEKHIRDLSLSSELREALNNNQLMLYYQPKYSLTEKKVVEAEALLRWMHPVKGFIPPDQIIHAAEASGLIHPLTEWVVGTAIKQQKQWEQNGIDIGIAVNMSVYNLQNPYLITIIKYLMSEHGTRANKLILEVTEGAMMQNPKLASQILSELDGMSIKVAIDDFGTGYSSLAYLKNLPVDELKIDKSFVLNLKDDDNDLAIVRSTIDLAHNLNLSVVAEGVENIESWKKLEDLGCDVIQGFYLSKPLPVVDFEPWFHKPKPGLIPN